MNIYEGIDLAFCSINGIQIYYELFKNEKARETIVFLNGVMASASSWIFQTEFFKKYPYQLLVQDFRGQMLSDKPAGPYSLKLHADDVLALLNALNIEKAHIVGTSYGGEVGMRFAIDYPEKVISLTVIDSVSEIDALLDAYITQWSLLAQTKNPDIFYLGMLPTIYGTNFIKKNRTILDKRLELVRKADPSFFDGQVILYESCRKINITAELKLIKSPTLVVCGKEDFLKPVRFSRLIAEQIPHSEFFIIPDCGHVTILEKPEILNSLLLGFISKYS